MSTVNLLPSDVLKKRSQSRANILLTLLFAVVMGAVIAATIFSERKSRQARKVRERTHRSCEEAARLIHLTQQLDSKRATMVRKAELDLALLEKVPRSYLLALVTNALPKQTAITQVSIETIKPASAPVRRYTRRGSASAAPAPSKAPPATPQIQAKITGLAGTDVELAKFIANLARNPLTGSVDLVYSQEKMIGEISVREFQVILKLKPDASVYEGDNSLPQRPGTHIGPLAARQGVTSQ